MDRPPMPSCQRIFDGIDLNDELATWQSQWANSDPAHAVDQNLGRYEAVRKPRHEA